jgi:GT2 family glycosyltransferase
LASVVIVCYNQARYLADAIRSARAQSYSSLEVLVVDDGSTDQTPEVAATFPAVRYIRQNNSGLAAARNAGLRSCRGEYVTFLDADDKLLPHAVEAGIGCFSDSPEAAFVFGRYSNIFDDGSPAPTPVHEPVESEYYWRLLHGNFIGMHAAVLYRRSVLAAAGGFDESLPACEDYEVYLRLAQQFPVRHHSHVIAEYRQHDSNMSKDHAFMLRQVLTVLERERRRAPDRRCSRALRRGVRIWREYYGSLLLEEWKQAPSLRGLLKVFRLWPHGVLQRIPRTLARRAGVFPRRRTVRLGSLRRLTPVSSRFGFDRGQPVDRHYVESFLRDHARAIRGRVLEIGDDSYSRRFGAERVTQQDVLHVVPGHPAVTIVADLANAPHIPPEAFDCIVLTQTLHYIFDLDAAVATLWRILKPGGVLLVTLPGISRICRDQEDKEADCWRFTASSARKLFEAHFGTANTRVQTYGNVLTAVAFLEGLAVEDLRPHELDHHDPDYQVTIAVAAVKGNQENAAVFPLK